MSDSGAEKLQKVIIILGATASGKTNWSLRLAQKYQGEIISADSRQIYKKMDIGTAKPKGEWLRNGLRKTFFVENVPHHLIDFLDPGKTFTVAEFRDKAIKYIKLAHKQARVPFIVGGTGLYISSVVDNLKIPRIPPNKKLRRSLEQKSEDELVGLLRTLDPVSASRIDKRNKRRIIRALEVCIFTGEPFSRQQKKGEPLFDILQIGITVDKDTLHARIEERIAAMIEQGLSAEVQKLVEKKYRFELPSMSGIGYRQFKEYFEGKISLSQVQKDLVRDTWRYARRQMSWFKRDERITWVSSYEEAEALVQKFLSK